MQVNTNYNSPAFGKFYIDKSAAPALKKLSVTQLKQITKWKKELANTENFDLFLSKRSYDDKLELSFLNNSKFIPRHNSDAPLMANEIKGNTIRAYAFDGNDDYTYYSLQYPTTKRAQQVFSKLNNQNTLEDNLITRIANSVEAVKFLEESYIYMGYKAGKEKVIDIIRRYNLI